MENLISCSSIMDWFEKQVAQKLPVSPSQWLEGATRMNVLLADEQEKLFNLEHSLSMVERDLHEKDYTSSKAKVYIKAMTEYKDMQVQKAKIAQITEFIRLAKHRSRMAMDEAKGYA